MGEWFMGLEPFDFSRAVMLPNGTLADVRQTDIQRRKLEAPSFAYRFR